MRAAIPLALCVVLAHLAGRYLWFESFRHFLPERSRNRMILSFFILGALNVAFYLWIFSYPAYMIMAYKGSIVLGWIPYVLLSFYWLPRLIAQQIFVFGMQGLWLPLLHTISMVYSDPFLWRRRNAGEAVHGAFILPHLFHGVPAPFGPYVPPHGTVPAAHQ